MPPPLGTCDPSRWAIVDGAAVLNGVLLGGEVVNAVRFRDTDGKANALLTMTNICTFLGGAKPGSAANVQPKDYFRRDIPMGDYAFFNNAVSGSTAITRNGLTFYARPYPETNDDPIWKKYSATSAFPCECPSSPPYPLARAENKGNLER